MYVLSGFDDAEDRVPSWTSISSFATLEAALVAARDWIESNGRGRVDVAVIDGRVGAVVRVVTGDGVATIEPAQRSGRTWSRTRSTRWTDWWSRPPQRLVVGAVLALGGLWMLLWPTDNARYSASFQRVFGTLAFVFFASVTIVGLVRRRRARNVLKRQPRGRSSRR